MYKPGDRVVFTATKHSDHPGPRAEDVEPEPHGEGYSYAVRKYWLVVSVDGGGAVTMVTRRGKERILPSNDPRLRPARWWESLLLSSRFPQWPPARETLPESANQRISA